MYRRVAAGRRPDGDAVAAGRHCWVLDSADRQGVKRAGLLLEWRRSPVDASREGRVVYLAQLRPEGWASVEEWIPAALLEPA
jgi:hypothetical protein